MTIMKTSMLKIYGERNVGTNYLHSLIAKNLDVDLVSGVTPKPVRFLQNILPGEELIRNLYFKFTFPQTLGWKHALAEPERLKHYANSREVKFVTISKNPYSWLLSLYKRPYHRVSGKDWTFETFLKSPWQTIDRENTIREYINPIALWNHKNESYIHLKNSLPTVTVRYEDLLADPQKTIENICTKLSCCWKNGGFSNHNESTKEKTKDFSSYQDYYLNEKWKEKLTPESIAFINTHLDDKVMQYFEYQQLAQ